jgi:hypothetical protein
MEISNDEKVIENIKGELIKYSPKTKGRIIEKIILAALGSIPWVGALLSTAATFKNRRGHFKNFKFANQKA